MNLVNPDDAGGRRVVLGLGRTSAERIDDNTVEVKTIHGLPSGVWPLGYPLEEVARHTTLTVIPQSFSTQRAQPKGGTVRGESLHLEIFLNGRRTLTRRIELDQEVPWNDGKREGAQAFVVDVGDLLMEAGREAGLTSRTEGSD